MHHTRDFSDVRIPICSFLGFLCPHPPPGPSPGAPSPPHFSDESQGLALQAGLQSLPASEQGLIPMAPFLRPSLALTCLEARSPICPFLSDSLCDGEPEAEIAGE